MSEHIKAAFEHRLPERIPRGEFWIETSVFSGRQLEDTIPGHVALCHEMGMDFISIPIASTDSSVYGYRTFNPAEINQAAASGLFVIAVIDGPLQVLVNRKGLQPVLSDIAKITSEISETVLNESRKVSSLVETCIRRGANAVMIAEDIAYEQGTFFSPTAFRNLLCQAYSNIIDTIHRHDAFGLYHSCGNISDVIPDIVSLGTDGLSCQAECLDLPSLKQDYGAKITLFTGVGRELLDVTTISTQQKQQFSKLATELGANGGFVLSSSSGLSSPQMASKLLQLYGIADETWNLTKKRR